MAQIAAQILRELATHYFPVECFEGSSDLAGTGSTFFSGGLSWRQLRFGGNWLHIIIQWISLEAAQIWRELALCYFPADCSGGSSELAGTGFTLLSGRLFWRQLRFGGSWLHINFHQIVMEAAQIWRELTPHYFPGLFWRQLRFGMNWLQIIFWWIVLEAAQIWRELAPPYFPADCFGGSSDLAGTGSTLFSGGLYSRQLRFGGNWLHIIFWQIVFEAAQIRRELASHYFPVDFFGGSSDLA